MERDRQKIRESVEDEMEEAVADMYIDIVTLVDGDEAKAHKISIGIMDAFHDNNHDDSDPEDTKNLVEKIETKVDKYKKELKFGKSDKPSWSGSESSSDDESDSEPKWIPDDLKPIIDP